MARLETTGIEDIISAFDDLADVPDDVMRDMLLAGGEVVATAQRNKLKQLGLYKTGKLHDSIAVHEKRGKSSDWRRYVLIYPEGDHHTYRRTAYTKLGYGYVHRDNRWYTVGGDEKTATNNEVGFVHEYGAPKRNIKAKLWMKKANEGCAEATTEAQSKVFFEWLNQKNL